MTLYIINRSNLNLRSTKDSLWQILQFVDEWMKDTTLTVVKSRLWKTLKDTSYLIWKIDQCNTFEMFSKLIIDWLIDWLINVLSGYQNYDVGLNAIEYLFIFLDFSSFICPSLPSICVALNMCFCENDLCYRLSLSQSSYQRYNVQCVNLSYLNNCERHLRSFWTY